MLLIWFVVRRRFILKQSPHLFLEIFSHYKYNSYKCLLRDCLNNFIVFLKFKYNLYFGWAQNFLLLYLAHRKFIEAAVFLCTFSIYFIFLNVNINQICNLTSYVNFLHHRLISKWISIFYHEIGFIFFLAANIILCFVLQIDDYNYSLVHDS